MFPPSGLADPAERDQGAGRLSKRELGTAGHYFTSHHQYAERADCSDPGDGRGTSGASPRGSSPRRQARSNAARGAASDFFTNLQHHRPQTLRRLIVLTGSPNVKCRSASRSFAPPFRSVGAAPGRAHLEATCGAVAIRCPSWAAEAV